MYIYIYSSTDATKDSNGFLLTSELPEISDAAAAVTNGPAASSSNVIGDGHTPASGSSAASFRTGCHLQC